MSEENNAITSYVQACLELTGKVKKDAENPHFKSTYATLDAVLETILPVCQKHKIVPLQEIIRSEGGISVKTTIYHESGDKLILEAMPIPVDKNNAHGVVSASTYGRRVSLMAIFALAPSDDDGNAAVASSEAEVNILVNQIKDATEKGDWATLSLLCRQEVWVDAWSKLDSHKKGKINTLTKKCDEYRDQINLLAEKDDQSGVLELWDELDETGKKAVWPTLADNTHDFLRKIKTKEAA